MESLLCSINQELETFLSLGKAIVRDHNAAISAIRVSVNLNTPPAEKESDDSSMSISSRGSYSPEITPSLMELSSSLSSLGYVDDCGTNSAMEDNILPRMNDDHITPQVSANTTGALNDSSRYTNEFNDESYLACFVETNTSPMIKVEPESTTPSKDFVPAGIPFSLQWKGYIWNTDEEHVRFTSPKCALSRFTKILEQNGVLENWEHLMRLCMNDELQAFLDSVIRHLKVPPTLKEVCREFNSLGQNEKEVQLVALRRLVHLKFEQPLSQFIHIFSFHNRSVVDAEPETLAELFLEPLPVHVREGIQAFLDLRCIKKVKDIDFLLEVAKSYIPFPLKSSKQAVVKNQCNFHVFANDHTTKTCPLLELRQLVYPLKSILKPVPKKGRKRTPRIQKSVPPRTRTNMSSNARKKAIRRSQRKIRRMNNAN